MSPLRCLLRSILSASCVLLPAAAALAGGVPTPYTVTVNDVGDNDTDDAVCTLREAIIAANAHASYHGCVLSGAQSPTTIAFNIAGSGVRQIAVASRLPAIATRVVLDGLSQPGADCTAWPPTLLIEITSTNGQYNGLTLDPGSDGSIVRGLVINGFNNNVGYAYNFNAAINIYTSNTNSVECNFLGTDPTGTTAVANLRAVDINGASNNVIGSDGTAKPYFARNLISGNSYGQVNTRGNALSGNRISGNFIGTDVTGTVAIGGGVGVDISANPGPATGNVVGWDGFGDADLMRNVISGFTGSQNAAVSMVVGAVGNQVAGNYIGTDVTGKLALPNFAGVELGSNASVYHNIIGNAGDQDPLKARNVISGNTFFGVDINGANGTHDNAVVGNYIGVNADGSAALANGSYGISMDFSTANTLVARNWLAGSPVAIRFFGSPGFGGGATAAFINNGGGAILDLPALDSSGNCVLSATGVQVYAQGASVPNPNYFESNWWGTPAGPGSIGASTADGSIAATPFLTAPAAICDDTLFRDGFEGP